VNHFNSHLLIDLIYTQTIGMKLSLSFIVFILVSFLCLVRSAIDSNKLATPPGIGYLIVQKKITVDPTDGNSLFAQDKNFTVNIHIYNVGTSSVYDIEVNDNWPKESFILRQGSTSFKADETGSDENMQFNYTITPNTEGEYIVSPAIVRYQPTEKASVERTSPQIGYSTSAKNITFLSLATYQKITAKHYTEWSIFGIGSALTVIIPLVIWIQIQFDYVGGLPKQPRKQ